MVAGLWGGICRVCGQKGGRHAPDYTRLETQASPTRGQGGCWRSRAKHNLAKVI